MRWASKLNERGWVLTLRKGNYAAQLIIDLFELKCATSKAALVRHYKQILLHHITTHS